jgi:hypothetical protein
MVEVRIDEGISVNPNAPKMGEDGEIISGDEGVDGFSGDRIVTSDGEVIATGGVERLKGDDEAPLVELYEAQALAANPFLVAPSMGPTAQANQVGAPTIAALLLDNMSGMAAVSFAQKAINSGMLTSDEGNSVLAIVQLASPGETEDALEDHLSHRELLTFSALVTSWREVKNLRGEE